MKEIHPPDAKRVPGGTTDNAIDAGATTTLPLPVEVDPALPAQGLGDAPLKSAQ